MAHALALAVTDPRADGRIFNAADGRHSTLALAEKVKAALNWEGKIVTAPAEQLPEPLRWGMPAQDLAVRADRIAPELGYAPLVPFDDGLRRTVAWERATPLQDPSADESTDQAQAEALVALRLDS